MLIFSIGVGLAILSSNKKNKIKAVKQAARPKMSQQTSSLFEFKPAQSHDNSHETAIFYEKLKSVSIQRQDVSLYLVYVGTSPSNYPHLISTNSNLGTPSSNLSGTLGYWPSYSAITDDDRATYLRWHQDGRRDPAADIGYVFIYFYGLEYRAIKENKNHSEIYAELLSLHQVYADKNASFAGYCRDFITWLILQNPQWEPLSDLNKINFFNGCSRMGTELLWRLPEPGKESNIDNFSLDGDNFSIPSSISQHSREIVTRFKAEVKRADIDIAQIKVVDHSIFYRHATAIQLGQPINLRYLRPMGNVKKKMFEIWNEVLGTYLVYGRVQKSDSIIGKLTNPEQKDSPEIQRLSNILLTFVHFTDFNQFNLGTLLKELGFTSPSLNLAESRALSHLLSDYGVQIEPDANLTNKAYKIEEEVILFKDPRNILRKDQWAKVSSLLDISISVAMADSTSQGSEITHTLNFISKQFKLNESEARRLQMRSVLLQKIKISSSAIAKKMASVMSQKEASVLAKFLFSIAAHDGVIHSSEMKALDKIYKAMGIPDLTLDSLTKEFTETNKGQLVKLEPSVKKVLKKGSKIPTPSLVKETEVRLNESALQSALDDAKELSKILSSVFVEEAVQTPATSKDLEDDHPSEVLYLGTTESVLLKALSTKDRWDISEVEELCRQNQVMYGAFFNKVNNYYEEKLGKPLLEEDGDEVTVALELAHEVHSA